MWTLKSSWEFARAIIAGMGSSQRNKRFRHPWSPHPLRTEYKKCQRVRFCTDWLFVSCWKQVRNANLKALRLGWLTGFSISASQVLSSPLPLVSEIPCKLLPQLLLVCARVHKDTLTYFPLPGAAHHNPRHPSLCLEGWDETCWDRIFQAPWFPRERGVSGSVHSSILHLSAQLIYDW